MKCPNCKNNIPNDSKFCNHCGQRIEENGGVIKCTNPKCGKEIPSDSKFCPFCGESLATTSTNSHGLVFPYFTVVLGETTIQELIDISEEKDINYECSVHDESVTECEFTSGVRVVAKSMNSPIFGIGMEDYSIIPSWCKKIIPIDEWSTRKLASYCRRSNLQYQVSEDNEQIFIMLSEERCVLLFDEGHLFMVLLLGCPKCGGKALQLEEIENEDSLLLRCKSCKNKFDMMEVYFNLKVCPSCGSTDIIDDGSGYVQFSCNNCGYVWGNEEENDDEDDDLDGDEECNDSGYGTYVIHEECVRCDACINVCPADAITAGYPYSINPDICICCGTCEDECPIGAISMND